MNKILTIILCSVIILVSCSKEGAPKYQQPVLNNVPKLIFKLHFDSTLARLDNFGNPSNIPTGNSAQTPQFNLMGLHSIEFTEDSLTALGLGSILYSSPITTLGGAPATDFNQLTTVGDGGTFYSIPIPNITPGNYKWARVALTYQNYNIYYLASGNFYTGTLASFVDDITYIANHTINTQNINVYSNKSQGYWAFETLGLVFEGQATGTTVPNPISTSSPIPAGSCVITGRFPSDLVITGNETSDIVVTFNLSINNSFEWKDLNSDGLYEPSDGINPGDTVVDMGLRGLFPTYQ